MCVRVYTFARINVTSIVRARTRTSGIKVTFASAISRFALPDADCVCVCVCALASLLSEAYVS